jgi:mono/diheme cytochrome c family protein
VTSAVTGGGTSGQQVFVTAQCGGCHTLAAAGAHGKAAANLDERRPSLETALRWVRQGGGSMPAFGKTLSDSEIQAVARYVADNAGR